MRHLITVTLLASFVFLPILGCYSSSSITAEGEAWHVPSPNQSIVVRTTGGREIEVPEYHFIEVKQPSDFVFGVGERTLKGGSATTLFNGRFLPVSRHDEAVLEAYSWGRSERIRSFVFVLPDSSTVRMKESDCVIVDSMQGAGLWCTGVYRSGLGYERFNGRIPFDRIETIEVKQFSYLKTTLLGLGLAGTATFFFLLSLAPHF